MGDIISMEEQTEALLLCADIAIGGFLAYKYLKKAREAYIVDHAKSYMAGSEVLEKAIKSSSSKTLPYVCIEGVARCTGVPLRSLYKDRLGVVLHQMFVEHKSKKSKANVWKDVRHIVHDSMYFSPFEIAPCSANLTDSEACSGAKGVEIVDPLSAAFLSESLVMTYNSYQPAQDDLLAKTVDRLVGSEFIKGLHKIERVLDVGAPIIGIGRLTLSPGDCSRMRLDAPTGGQKFIITTMTKSEVVRLLKYNKRAMRGVLAFLGLFGALLLAHLLYNNYQLRQSLLHPGEEDSESDEDILDMLRQARQ